MLLKKIERTTLIIDTTNEHCLHQCLVGVYVRTAWHPCGGAVGDVRAGRGAALPREPGPGGLHQGAAEAEDQRGQHRQPAPAPPTHAGDKLSLSRIIQKLEFQGPAGSCEASPSKFSSFIFESWCKIYVLYVYPYVYVCEREDTDTVL